MKDGDDGPRPRYHHGDLRAALLQAGEALLTERGPEGFTLRECARRVGVSNAAPAHHFRDLPALLAALATLGFERLCRAMREARDAAGADPAARLAGLGRGYVRFAAQHPALFRLMFHSSRTGVEGPDLAAAGGAAYRLLLETVAALDPDGAEALDPALACWSSVHGFATLLVEGRLTKDPRFGPADDWPQRLEPLLAALLRGLVAPG